MTTGNHLASEAWLNKTKAIKDDLGTRRRRGTPCISWTRPRPPIHNGTGVAFEKAKSLSTERKTGFSLLRIIRDAGNAPPSLDMVWPNCLTTQKSNRGWICCCHFVASSAAIGCREEILLDLTLPSKPKSS